MEQNNSSVILYTTEDGKTQLDVKLENETVWLSVNQMSALFSREESNIRRHILNIFKEGELIRESNVQKIHVPFSDKLVPYYSLDVIISVGYRVKSVSGTRFRQWANSVLKQYLIQGYAINQQRLDHYQELKDVVHLMSRALSLQEKVSNEEYNGLINVVSDYVYALDTLDHYDYQELTIDKTSIVDEPFHATYENAMQAINVLRDKFGGSALFAHEKDESFHSSIGQIYQTFDGVELYPSIEEKAAMLLYLVVKNHSFSDGNKRIAAMLFLWFLDSNHILYAPDGHKRIADNTLVALTLMIAESRPEEKDVMVKVVVNLINQNNC